MVAAPIASASGWLAAQLASIASALVVNLAPALGQSQQEISWVAEAPWAKVGLVITVAVFVLTLGGAMAKRRPKRGRVASSGRADFDLQIAKLESLPVTPIANALNGPVHLEAVIASSNEALGGSPQHARVYHNRKGASRKAAVAAELVVVRDDSGQVAVEGLEHARVIAAKDPKSDGRSQAPDTISLFIGDRVQLLGHFRSERHGDDAKAAERIFGVLGDDGQIQVRLLERFTASAADPVEADANAQDGPKAIPKPQGEAVAQVQPAGANESPPA